MKTPVFASVLTLIFALGTALTATAQCDWKWPEGEEKSKVEEALVLLKDNKSNGHFKQAAPSLNWLLTSYPQLHTSVYIYGADVYEGLAKAEKDPAKKQIYVDSLMLIYDLRIKNCGEEASVTNRKAVHFYMFNINKSGKEKELLELMDKTFELAGNDVMDATLVPYMQVMQINKIKLKKLTDDEILKRYDRLMSVVDAKIKEAQAAGKPVDRYKKYKEQIDEILLSDGMLDSMDCAFIKKNLEPKFKANPADPDMARKVFLLMLKAKCTDDPVWLEAGEAYIKDNPDFTIIKNLAIKYWVQDNFSKAEELFKKALQVASSNKDKAEILINLAGVEAKKGDKPQARELLRQALAAEPGNKEAYEKIGDLYMTSSKDCSKEQSYAEDRLIFIAAYEMYAKAGNQQKMAQAKSQFPSNEELFTVGWKEGESKKIECWIGETVVLRSRGKT